jgi:hypothetical protein
MNKLKSGQGPKDCRAIDRNNEERFIIETQCASFVIGPELLSLNAFQAEKGSYISGS